MEGTVTGKGGVREKGKKGGFERRNRKYEI